MSTSDLFLYDLSTKENKQITFKQRFYHPQFSQDGTKIVTVEYTKKNNWDVVVLDTNGSELHRIASTSRHKIVEAVFKSDNELYAITLDELGYKEISKINLTTKEITSVSPQNDSEEQKSA